MHWDVFEEIVLNLSPVPAIEINVENRVATDGAGYIFKWLLDTIPKQSILPRIQEQGRLDVRFALTDRSLEWRGCEYISLHQVLSAASEHRIDGHSIKLAPPDVFALMLCSDPAEQIQFLRQVNAKNHVVASEVSMPGNDGNHLPT